LPHGKPLETPVEGGKHAAKTEKKPKKENGELDLHLIKETQRGEDSLKTPKGHVLTSSSRKSSPRRRLTGRGEKTSGRRVTITGMRRGPSSLSKIL